MLQQYQQRAPHDPVHADPLWYKDAVIYQVHVKAYFDSDDDGVGDFAGLTGKLDYLNGLGVTALWLLPFYPSPLRDDGYDISDYRHVHRPYGGLRDFRRLVRECHRRGMRVITELVINHTSDQHPWFRRARLARPGSVFRNYYVWSDSDERYAGTRVIFLDSERSNWTWDEEAHAYFWHRFYSHQPDLNFDNPRVLVEVMRILRHWLDMGVDGLRLDAVPYLIEREGTGNENLPETHSILKRLRSEVDARYHGRVLLAEANQWPEDVLAYFGNGDECHMAFHFPLMPRLYMAIAREDRHPVTDIMHQTPAIPEQCQWAIFLRNHDELTLEMVTEHERDYLWKTYAQDRHMRINLGIRRRLAPLMGNDRRKIELMNGLLYSLPGTPVMYYGDEIGMGDNVFLGDRDGLRTPMQWSPDRNGGFSRADPPHLYLPPIMDPVYGFGALNVEAQARSQSSLLNWTRRMLGVRRQHRAFGRGSIAFLFPVNRKVLAYVREYDDEVLLCVFNLSAAAQPVELDLSRFKHRIPVELFGRNAFPPIGDLYYLLTLPAYGFHWFLLATEEAVPAWHATAPGLEPDFITMVTRGGLHDIVGSQLRSLLEREVVPPFLSGQRWYARQNRRVESAMLCASAMLDENLLLTEVEAVAGDGSSVRYFLPLALVHDRDGVDEHELLAGTLARIRQGSHIGMLVDAAVVPAAVRCLLDNMRRNEVLEVGGGRFTFTSTPRIADLAIDAGTAIRRLGVEQSNTSIRIGDATVLKLYRRLAPGLQPEVEAGRFLTEVGFANTPPLQGTLEHTSADGVPTTLAIAQGFVDNQGDGWAHVVAGLRRRLEEIVVAGQAHQDPAASFAFDTDLLATLGRRSAELHRALATPTGVEAFAPEPIVSDDLCRWRGAAQAQAERAFDLLAQVLDDLGDPALGEARTLLARRSECLSWIERLGQSPLAASKTRIHGDYHLGQVLKVKDDWMIVDLEGEPETPLPQRRAKQSPLRDVAGMLRSFDYAAAAAQLRLAPVPDAIAATVAAFAQAWHAAATNAFLGAYRESITGVESYPLDAAAARCWTDLFSLERACYEIVREINNRPDWVLIPVRGVAALLDRHAAAPGAGGPGVSDGN